jgi:hypothetical protein
MIGKALKIQLVIGRFIEHLQLNQFIMKKSLLVASVMAASMFTSNAQFKVTQNFVGKPIETRSTDGFVGDKYLYPDWMTGNVLQEDGKFYNNMSLKYDLYNDMIIFNSTDNVPMAFKYPIKEFQLMHKRSLEEPFSLFKNGFPPFGNYSAKTFYQVLTEGKTSLIKKPYKSIIETIPYGESELKKTFGTNELYFLHHNGKMVKIQKSKNSVLEVLGDKKSELIEFIKDKKLRMKSDSDLVAVVNHYNALK